MYKWSCKRGKNHVKWGWKVYTTPVRMFAASISVLLTDLASCLFSSGQHNGLEDYI